MKLPKNRELADNGYFSALNGGATFEDARRAALQSRFCKQTTDGLTEKWHLTSDEIRKERDALIANLYESRRLESAEKQPRAENASRLIGAALILIAAMLFVWNTNSPATVGPSHHVAASVAHERTHSVTELGHHSGLSAVCQRAWMEYDWLVIPALAVVGIKLLAGQSPREITACLIESVAFLLKHGVEVVLWASIQLRHLARDLRGPPER